MKLPEKITNLADAFSKIPGVGEKTALRNVLSLTNWDDQDLESFSNSLRELISLKRCEDCGAYADEDICEVCKDPHRKSSKQLCVVESITDCMAIERSGQFFGIYHILGGVLNPLLGIGPTELKLEKLCSRIQEYGTENVILAISPSVEGDATCSYIREVIPAHVEIDRIGFGIPMGGNLDYLDSMTISKALENKRKI